MLYQDILASINKDSSSMEKLISRFAPLLNKYSRRMYSEDAKQEITLFFLELLHKIPSELLTVQSEGKIVNYISASIKHYYIQQKDKEHAVPVIQYFEDNQKLLSSPPKEYVPYDHHNNLLLCELKTILTQTEFEIIVLLYFYQYSISQIALIKKRSRQSINQTKLKALQKLKKTYI